jgi:DNA polymerase I
MRSYSPRRTQRSALTYNSPRAKAVKGGRDGRRPAAPVASARPSLTRKVTQRILEERRQEVTAIAREMEARGFRLDKVALASLLPQFKGYKENLALLLAERVPLLNPDSDRSIRETFERRGIALELLDDVRSGESTGVEVADLLIEYRRMSKLVSDARRFVKAAKRDSEGQYRIHPTFIPQKAVTGRWTSENPSLHQVPRRGDGAEIRRAFLGSPFLIKADFSQLEPRVLALLSGDKALRRAIEKDLYLDVAESIGLSRDQAKIVVLAIMYGMSPRTLARKLDVETDDAVGIMGDLAGRFPAAFNYLARQEETAEVRSLQGRVLAPQPGERNKARNFSIQATAAELAEEALVSVYSLLAGSEASIVNFVHDEIVIEYSGSYADAEATALLVKQAMESVARNGHPLVVEVGIGKNWLDTKEVQVRPRTP